MAPINDLVPDCAEESFSRFRQEHELLNAVGLNIALEQCDELVPQAALPMTGGDSERAQQGVHAEPLHPDDSDD